MSLLVPSSVNQTDKRNKSGHVLMTINKTGTYNCSVNGTRNQQQPAPRHVRIIPIFMPNKYVHLRNNVHFSDIHRSMNTMALVQSKCTTEI